VVSTGRRKEAAVTYRRSDLQGFEGQQICVALADGSRIDDCQLVSIGRGRVVTLWLFTNSGDAFVPFADVVDVWASGSSGRRRAA
jgi:hypothetical protein